MSIISENVRLNIGPIIQGVHCAYEPPTTLQIPMASDDSPDDDGTVESIGSKSVGSSPSSSHSDMSSPMFKPESLIVRTYSIFFYSILNSILLVFAQYYTSDIFVVI